MPVKLTVYFSDGFKKTFDCEDDEDATMKRDDLLEMGFEEKIEGKRTFYPVYSITKIVVAQD
jgi:hypothetical protein